VASIGQGVAAGVAQYVGVNRKCEAGAGTDALDVKRAGRQAALALEQLTLTTALRLQSRTLRHIASLGPPNLQLTFSRSPGTQVLSKNDQVIDRKFSKRRIHSRFDRHARDS
jgi:hypothetical protein